MWGFCFSLFILIAETLLEVNTIHRNWFPPKQVDLVVLVYIVPAAYI